MSTSKKQKNLILLITSRTAVTVGTQMLTTVAAWQMYELSHSPLWLGFAGLAQYLPMLTFFLITGRTADHFDRRAVVATAEATVAVCALLLAIFNYNHLITKEILLIFLAVIGGAFAFQGPAAQSLLPNLVSKKTFPRATAAFNSAYQISTIVGPAIGGFLIKAGDSFAYSVITICAIISVTCILSIKTNKLSPKKLSSKKQKQTISFKSLFEGLIFIKSKPAIFGAISLDMFVVLFGGATALLPIYASSILHVGSTGYGILRSSQALGALAVSIILAKRSIKNRVGMKMFACVIGFGITTIIFAISKNIIISILALAALGAFDVVSMIVRSSFVQLNTPDELRGRVSSVNLLFIGTSNQLGEFESGTVAALIGTVPTVFIGGVLAIGITVAWAFLFPELRKLNSF